MKLKSFGQKTLSTSGRCVGSLFLFLALTITALAQTVQSLDTLALAAGETHALALRSDGTVWAWGTNRIGETGLGALAQSSTPKRIASLSNVVAIAAGPLHSLAVQSNGVVWAWGTNGNGQLGNGTYNNSTTPVAVSLLTNAVNVAIGVSHSLAVLADGSVMAWGANDGGQLGNGSNQPTNQPAIVTGVSNVTLVSAGQYHSLALTTNGEVWSWGDNSYGQLGVAGGSHYAPIKVSGLSNIVQIASGQLHSLAIDVAGRIFTWGDNYYGELGNGTTSSSSVPVLITNLGPVRSIAANYYHSAAIGTNGNLYYWGFNTFSGSVTQPALLGADQQFNTVTLGHYFILATQADGSVWAWGTDNAGQWGNGNTYISYPDYELSNLEFSFAPYPYAQAARFNRGDRGNLSYDSFVLPLDLEKGVKLDADGSDLYGYGLGTPWFLRLTNTPTYQTYQLVNGTTNVTRFLVQNPIAVYGSLGGGSPLYTGQGYTFGVYAGAYDETSGVTNIIRVSVYDRAACIGSATNITPVNVFNIAMPRRSVLAESNAWLNFVTNGFMVLSQSNGLTTTVEFVDGPTNNKPWGLGWATNLSGPLVVPNVVMAGYRLTHTASTTNYCYKVEVLGSAQVGTTLMAPMATNNAGTWTPLPAYTLDFENLPPWRSAFIDLPHFEGIPIPPTYAGRSPKELAGMIALVTNNISLSASVYTNLDTSPELFQHPILNQFVDDMGHDPLALATYVINEIELTDPFANTDKSKVVASAINPGGINRSALAVFQEKQGSPTEQCALLVYLLRRAGYPAAYVWPTNNNLRLLDTTVSKLWQIQVKGVVYNNGIPYITNSLIAANYPWVVATIGTNCVHIFPWLKDHEIVEGANLYDYLPANYNTAYAWVKAYALGNTNILNLAPESNLPLTLWPLFLTRTLQTNSINQQLSLDDFGVRCFNRRNQFPDWQHLPMPNYLTNQDQVSVTATLSDDTNTYPFLANIFDRIRVEVYSNNIAAPNLLFNSQDWYACNWHNRKLLLYTNTPTSLTFWLAPLVSGVTNSTAFSAGPYSTNLQTTSIAVTTNSSQLMVRVVHTRRKAAWPNPVAFFPLSESAAVTNDATCQKGDVAAVCFSFGQVTPNMLRIHAEDYWKLEQRRSTNTSFIPSMTDNQGTAAMLLGMGYFERLSRFDVLNQQLHKMHGLNSFSSGLGVVGSVPKGTNMQAKVDMRIYTEATIGNGSLHPDAGEEYYSATEKYSQILICNSSAQEHDIINSTFSDPDAISTVRLLQLAAQRAATNSNFAAPIELNSHNYLSFGSATNKGYGTTMLKDQDPAIWQSVSNAFAGWDADYARVLITPGLVTNSTGTYKGMGALVLNKGSQGALISGNKAVLNGGWGGQVPSISFPSSPTYEPTYSLFAQNNGSYNFTYNNFITATPQFNFTPIDSALLTAGSGVSPIAWAPDQTAFAQQVGLTYNTGGGSTAFNTKQGDNGGFLGLANASMLQAGSIVMDPVNVVAGEFYADTVDLALPGPLPLQLRRNYLSRSLADSQFGSGWKQNFNPYLVVCTNAAGSALIYAAELDGAVIVYHLTNGIYRVLPQDNPTLNNNTTSGVGASANLFNARIDRYLTNGVTFVLSAPDGGRRTYQQMTNFAVVCGTNRLDRTRPYLTRWEDHAGNYHNFFYGTNATATDYGQLNRIESGTGNFLEFKYDFQGHILESFTGDGRRVQYEYDNYGDLTTVTLPDASQWKYIYQHYTFTTNSTTYSDSHHLLIQETKPNGRLLVNNYDSLRRVITQASTVGTNYALVTNAWFFYTNNCTSLTNDTLNGVTRVEDVFHNPTLYYYTNNLIMRTEMPLGRTNIQNWFDVSETNKPGYYPGSLEFTVDARGLTNEFRYDSFGNLTNLVMHGDLTGDGNSGQSSTNNSTYTTNNLPATITDPVGNITAYFYEDAADAWRATRVEKSNGGIGISTNRFSYTNVSSTVDMGYWTKTNRAFGLRFREVRGDAATNEVTFDGRGFAIQTVRYARTAEDASNNDPAVTTTFAYNSRGQVYQQTDAAGRSTTMDFDAMGRPMWRDVIDENAVSLARETFYYNRNGELEWRDGPATSPEDYTWYDYDGAGRKIQEIHWRARAKADGTGVEAETGDNLYATTFYNFDAFGNLTKVIDPRGSVVTNGYNALGELTVRKAFENNGTLLTSDGFAYENGGKVAFHTNALGGVTQTLYTSTGQPRFQSNPDNSTNAWRYYLDGRIKREIQGNGAYWQTTYDDANRKTTRIFYSAANLALATNVSVFDRRGNLIQKVDAGNNVFATTFDGLDRAKVIAGPAIVTVTPYQLGNPPSGPFYYATNVLQQAVTNYYDATGRSLTSANALGESTVTIMDALGRTTSAKIYSASGSLVHEKYLAYSADHHSTTITDGSGATAISHTTWTDNDGHTALSVAYPSANATEFTLNQYDLSGNLVSAQHNSSAGGKITTWTTTSLVYDGLNRLTSKSDRDNAITTYAYNPLNNLTNRTMPGTNFIWSAIYNNAGQMLQECNVGGGIGTRTNSYTYFAGGNSFAGLLQTKTDGRGVTCTYSYDDWLRVTTNTYTGSLLEQQLTTVLQYEPRGLVTGITEQFASTNTGPNTSVQRNFDPYGQLASEFVNVGVFSYGAGQTWDAAGRRSQLGIGGNNYGFVRRADGALTSASDSTGSGGYSYDTAGLLTNRMVGSRVTSITSRDGEGRPLSISTTVNTLSQLSETLAWSGDGLLTTHTLTRGDSMNDLRNYSYANLSRRLTREQLNLDASTTWTNTFAYDNGVAAGPGVLTSAGTRMALWNGIVDSFSRVSMATNNTVSYAAYGHVNGQSTLSAWLDNQHVSVIGVGTNAMQWRSMMELSSGVHQLKVAAAHPSGIFTTWATNSFTNSIAYQTTGDVYDNAGNITQRVWRNANGTTNRTQTLSWDARGRLHQVTERDAGNSGYNWTAIYDGLNRRLSTTSVLVTNGVVFNSQPNTINSYFDPQVEFLELGVAYGTKIEWKLYGPDLNGVYGGLNGTGGFDGVSSFLNLFNPTISDFRGNILGVVTNGVVSWNSARPTGYGAVPGYRPLALGNGADISLSSAWRGRWVDITGYHQIGLRPYDSVSGRWLTYDSVWNERDPNAYTFCGGDPVNGVDSDGRCVENAPPSVNITLQSAQGQNASGLNFETTTTALNLAGIAQFGAEYGSGAASIGINNASGGISLYTHFYGNQYTTAYMFSDIAHSAGPFAFVASAGLDVYGAYTGQEPPAQAAVNVGVGYIGLRGGPIGAAFAVGYGGGALINNFVPVVNGAAQTIIQPVMNLFYSPTYQVHHDPNSFGSSVNSVANPFP